VVKARYGKGAGGDSYMILMTTGANGMKLCKSLRGGSNRRENTCT